ncbi:DoxX family membrane protein [Brevundimonas sp. PAMC22021]|uniref:DoxX family membrane protein n=1 Tax=Brevundimonas sp. PAMC22021 TaxID=2861285 RepID=UPI001C634AFE|nr:DoxX family membrane protein [Brevundimonas sp. PAMC22021]QYF86077.1 DoxX family membrane protein [Brevundimonas sp. PAMC22021]
MVELYRGIALGWPGLVDTAPFVARIVVGGMFFLSGFYKLFSAQSAEKMQKTMVEAGIAAPRKTARFVSVCEFAGGALLILGLLTTLSAALLFIISLVALLTVTRKSVEGTSLGYRLSSYLDLPETLLMTILFWLMVQGPGLWSLDWALLTPRF